MSDFWRCVACHGIVDGPDDAHGCPVVRMSTGRATYVVQSVLADVAERLKRRAEALRAASPHVAEAIFLVANELEPEPDRRSLPESDEVEIRPIDDEGSGP